MTADTRGMGAARVKRERVPNAVLTSADACAELQVSAPTGKTYMLGTVDDLVAIYRDLPEHRREPFLSEICRSVRYQAAYADLLEATDSGKVSAGPGTWTDDGDDSIRIPTDVNGQHAFSLEIGRSSP